MDINPNKRLKEEFVSNLTGSSMLEIAALSTIVPALVVLRQWSCSSYGNGTIYAKEIEKKRDDANSSRKDEWSCMVALVMDFLCVILPIIFSFTVLAEWVYLCTTSLVLVLLFCISAKWLRSSRFHFKESSKRTSSLRAAILSYRVSVVLMTCLCILAVDFKIFPRRYAKTETYGTGLMDLGVGSFIVANSLVSRQARGAKSVEWKSALQAICPLLFLGFARLISTTGVDYQVHVGEYGVHWNFFFTLAAVSILTSIVNIHPKYCGIFGLLILTGYQACLLCGLNEYLISNERALDLVSQNKEGLFSIFDEKFKTGEAYDFFRQKREDVPWHKIVWDSAVVPKHSIIGVLALQNSLPTIDNLKKKHIQCVNRCILCKKHEESIHHLMFACDFSREILVEIKRWAKLRVTTLNLRQLLWILKKHYKKKDWKHKLYRCALMAVIYGIWQERNQRIFEGMDKSSERLVWEIKFIISIRMLYCEGRMPM